jgi:hypothetical protein
MFSGPPSPKHSNAGHWAWHVPLIPVVVLICQLSLVPAVTHAAEAADRTSIKAQLDAGEFSAAVSAAQSAPAGPERDAILAQIAVAQNQAGARGAAISTTFGMSSDQSRADSLSKLVPSSGLESSGKGGFGGNQADFDSLIDLITSTIAPTSWSDAGGTGSIAPFPTGVYVDAQGVLRTLCEDRSGGLDALRRSAATAVQSGNARQTSKIRKISLTRLEREVQRLVALGRQPTEEMRMLAGLQRIKYVLVYPESHDLVIAGPAGDWQFDADGRIVGKETGRPVVQLDDLVVVMRHMLNARDAKFGCAITPTQEALARTKEFVAESNRAPLRPGTEERDRWLAKLRDQMGRQNIEVYGLNPGTRAARVLVEADYRMKLVGVGLENGVLGVPSYLSMIQVPNGQSAPPMDVLRWWFTINYDALQATHDHDGFEFRGQGVKVLSENELLTATGQRVHTGASDVLNSEFARNFTKHFSELAVKYPIYADLQNIFDLALLGALMRSERLADRADWHLTFFGDQKRYRVEVSDSPKTIETVINHRVVNQSLILVGVSGGVSCDPTKLVEPTALQADYGTLRDQRAAAKPQANLPNVWWWD